MGEGIINELEQLIVIAILVEESSALTVRNVIAVAGSDATLNCNSSGTSSLATRWHFTDLGRTTPVCIYNGEVINEDFLPRYRAHIDTAASRCQLIIGDLRLSDAGTFRCSMLRSSRTISIFHLSVLGILAYVF